MKLISVRTVLIVSGLIILLNACKKDSAVVSLPTLTTLDLTAITNSSASCGGNITSDGGSAIIGRGVVYKKGTYPDYNHDSLTRDGVGTGQFASSLISLDPGSLYFVRAYAINSLGIAYGDQVTLHTLPVAVGDNFRGGKVAYILKAGDPNYSGDYERGLIALQADLPATNWGAYGPMIATPHGLGNGNVNTNTITTTLGPGTYAARVCADLVFPLAGFSDWYLPSIDEMNKLYLNQAIIGGFSGGNYWTSCSYDNSSAWRYEFGVGSYTTADKATANLVRPVRSF